MYLSCSLHLNHLEHCPNQSINHFLSNNEDAEVILTVFRKSFSNCQMNIGSESFRENEN